MLNDEKLKSLQLCIAALDREYGKGTIMKLDSDNIEPWPFVSTGVLTVDQGCGIGGLPLGRIVEIYGENSVGKSTLALSTIAEAQKEGLICAYIDVENALDPIYMKAMGVDIDSLYLSAPSYGEAALDIAHKLASSQAVSVIVIDSVAALVPKAEFEGKIGDNFMMLQARMMSQGLRMLSNSISANNVCLIFINQLREKPTMYGNPNVTSGGKALRFYASVRIELSKKEDIKNKNGDFLGIRSKAKFVKNKMAPALKTAEYDIIYGQGIDKVGCIVDIAEERGIVKKGGSWYSDPETGQTIAQGRDNLIIYLKEDKEYLETILEKINND